MAIFGFMKKNKRSPSADNDGKPLSPPGGALSIVDPAWLRAFGIHLWRHFRDDRSFESAAALSYTSLLALVPLMAVMLGVISAFPVFDQWATELETYIFSNFVPAAGDAVQAHLNQFVGRTAGLTGAGTRSEEHTSELQSRGHLVCRLLLDRRT